MRRFGGAMSHNPTAVVDQARGTCAEFDPQRIVAIGGSSAIDLGKAVVETNIAELVAIPTALGGSEMSRFYGSRADDGTKSGGTASRLLPSVVCYDPALLVHRERRDQHRATKSDPIDAEAREGGGSSQQYGTTPITRSSRNRGETKVNGCKSRDGGDHEAPSRDRGAGPCFRPVSGIREAGVSALQRLFSGDLLAPCPLSCLRRNLPRVARK